MKNLEFNSTLAREKEQESEGSTAILSMPTFDGDNEVKLQNANQEQIAESSENILETAMVYQKELHTCGQPTVKTTYDNNNERINKTDVLKSFSIPVQVCGMPPFRNCGSVCGNQKEIIEDYEKGNIHDLIICIID